jgi:prefoldin subunit 5
VNTLTELEKIGVNLILLSRLANKELDIINQDIETLSNQYAIINAIENCIDNIKKIIPNLE